MAKRCNSISIALYLKRQMLLSIYQSDKTGIFLQNQGRIVSLDHNFSSNSKVGDASRWCPCLQSVAHFNRTYNDIGKIKIQTILINAFGLIRTVGVYNYPI